jgi:hypothetical protein
MRGCFRVVPPLLVAAACLFTMGSGGAGAQAELSAAGPAVYWTNYAPAPYSPIGTKPLDGGPARLVPLPRWSERYPAVGLTIADGHLYWVENAFGQSIAEANLDGSGAHLLPIPKADVVEPEWLTVLAGHLYWTNAGLSNLGPGEANLDGSDPKLLLSGPLALKVSESQYQCLIGADGLSADSTHLFFTINGSVIGSSGLDGSDAQVLPIPSAFLKEPWDIAVSGQHLYWSNYAGNSIGEAELDGHAARLLPIVSPYMHNPDGIAVYGGRLYWVNADFNGTDQTIASANLDGSGATTIVPTGLTVNRGLVTKTGALLGPVAVAVGP